MESRERRTTGCLLFDWGNTLMRDFPQCRGPMMAWPTVEVIPGVVEALQAVRPQWQTALATNAVDSDEPCIWAALRRGGLRDLIDRVYCFRRVGHKKPSPQFYKQIMVGSGLERVFEAGHAYRAEKSQTSRHLTEYLSLDFEMGFIESQQDVMRTYTGLIRAIFEAVSCACRPILNRRGIEVPQVGEIPQISFPETMRVLAERFGKTEGLGATSTRRASASSANGLSSNMGASCSVEKPLSLSIRRVWHEPPNPRSRWPRPPWPRAGGRCRTMPTASARTSSPSRNFSPSWPCDSSSRPITAASHNSCASGRTCARSWASRACPTTPRSATPSGAF